jgi:LemA protein
MRACWLYRPVAVVAAGLIALSLGGCGYNNLQRQDENVKATWSEVVNQYQRRADLVPNLVNTVKGFAQQEQQVLIGVTEARAKVGSIQVSADVLNNPEAFARYQAAQNQLTQSLKSLLAVSERYPDLKSNENFRDLQAQLEGTENRITVARNRYIDAVREYNINVRSFPTNLTAKMFDFQVKPNFAVADEQAIATPPTVDFGTAKPPASPPAGGSTGGATVPFPPGIQSAPPRAPVEPGPPAK